MEYKYLCQQITNQCIKMCIRDRYIGTLSKYYFQDIGLRNALLINPLVWFEVALDGEQGLSLIHISTFKV